MVNYDIKQLIVHNINVNMLTEKLCNTHHAQEWVVGMVVLLEELNIHFDGENPRVGLQQLQGLCHLSVCHVK